MALQLRALRKALMAGATRNDLAEKASEELAGFDSRFAGIERKIEKLDGRVTLVQWQLAILIAGVLSIIIKFYA